MEFVLPKRTLNWTNLRLFKSKYEITDFYEKNYPFFEECKKIKVILNSLRDIFYPIFSIFIIIFPLFHTYQNITKHAERKKKKKKT
jgi:hypothetical protein